MEIQYNLLRDDEKNKLIELTRAIFQETNAQKKEIFDESFWNWQYNDGYSKNLNVIAKAQQDEGQIIGSYPNLILPLKYFNQSLQISICQDLLTASSYRGRGLFAQMGYLSERILKQNNIAVSCAFPNHRSLHGFIKKHHYHLLQEIPLYFKLLRGKSRSVSTDYTFDLLDNNGAEEINAIWEVFKVQHSILLQRNFDFIRWRFLKRPKNNYFTFILKYRGEAVGYIVLCFQRLYHLNVVLVMDYGFKGIDHLEALFYFSELFSKNNNRKAVILMTLARTEVCNFLKTLRYFKIYSFLNPRKFNFVIRANLDSIKSEMVANPKNWFLTFGDWDVF